jgi:CSLREA domain-containing protein
MYHQINPTETFHERQLALLKESENRRLARRLRAGREPKARSGTAASLGVLAALVMVAGLMLLALSSPAHASTTFIVNSTANTGDPSPDGTCETCTLREAIQEANNNSNPTETDQINFNISGDGVQTISPNPALPIITETVIINGYSQPGSSPNTLAKGTNAKLKIQLNGTNAEEFQDDGLSIAAKDTVVKGLVINRFPARAIGLLGGADANGTKIEGNFLGTNPGGTVGLGNHSSGLDMTANSNVTIGGTSPEARNLISGNDGRGLTIFGFGISRNNKVQGNLIGTDKAGTGNLGNGESGVVIIGGANTTVAANTIAFNGTQSGNDGVEIHGSSSTGNRILSNSIFSHPNGLGIDLISFPDEDGSTNVSNANDPGDTDVGPNNLQNKPVLTSAKTSGTKITIVGNLNSTPDRTFAIQFFSNPSGTDEGKTFIGQRSVTTNDNGNAPFTFGFAVVVPAGQSITATATGAGSTSEFSAPRAAVAQ